MESKTCYIVNFNAKEYVLSCLDSVINSSKLPDGIEICVVDNASTDGSAQAVKDTYGARVRVIENEKNLGGAGGFNTALRDAIDNNIKYAILLDNDIRVDKNCISNMISYLDEHADVGAVGAKIMIMDKPEFIQEFGGHLDMNNYYFKTDYWYEKDNENIENIESEWLTSCAVAVRMEAAKKTNLFPEENFLFWDDIQFTWEIGKSGYKLISLADAKVWHKGKKKALVNTSAAYYSMRNRTKFFAVCEKEERLAFFCEKILDEYFNVFFGSALKGLDKMNSTRMFALDDFVHKNYGKIRDDVLWGFDGNADKIHLLNLDNKKIFIKDDKNSSIEMQETINILQNRLEQLQAVVVDNEKDSDMVFVPCSHIADVKEDILPKIWFDKYLNIIADEKDYGYVKAMPYMKELFVKMHYDWLMQGIVEERDIYKKKQLKVNSNKDSML